MKSLKKTKDEREIDRLTSKQTDKDKFIVKK